jgi:L-ribulokinase
MAMKSKDSLVIGIDFGTDSVRCLIMDAARGSEEAIETALYPRWAGGRYCDPERNRFRQHPLDYIESLQEAVKGALKKLPKSAARRVTAIGIDTTGSTPCAVDKGGTPLALTKGFQENPNAMFVLWKDHTAVAEAERINAVARGWGGTDFTKYVGGVYSSEWFWSKILHVLKTDPAVRKAAFSWVEHCDWMPALLTGTADPLTMKRSRCAAGHKALWHPEWKGLPPVEFLSRVDPLLSGLRIRLYEETFTSDVKAGNLIPEWAKRLGLEPGITVAVGAFDAHMGAVGGGITEGTLVKIMGTSTCDMMIAKRSVIASKCVSGICGQVDGSIVPGMVGLEAGQSAFGDVYAWFKELLSWPLQAAMPRLRGALASGAVKLREMLEGRLLDWLAGEAEKLDPGTSSIIALDWLNGRRTPFADQTLKGAIAGLTLGSTAPRIYRALVEATAFGSRAIVDQLRKEGVRISEVIALGGVARKGGFVMQVTSDVLGMPIKVAASDQCVALGAGMLAAVAAGIHPTAQEAQKRMSGGFDTRYAPDRRRAGIYNRLYGSYLDLGKRLEDLLRRL